MPRTHLLRFLPVALLSLAAWGWVAWTPARATAADAGSVAAEEELEHAMEAMNGCVKSWAKGIDATSRDKALEQVAKFQSNVLAAKLTTPPGTEKIEESKRAEYVAGFRAKLVGVLATSCQLESALIASDFAAANKAVKDLLQHKQEGHDVYAPDEHDPRGR